MVVLFSVNLVNRVVIEWIGELSLKTPHLTNNNTGNALMTLGVIRLFRGLPFGRFPELR